MDVRAPVADRGKTHQSGQATGLPGPGLQRRRQQQAQQEVPEVICPDLHFQAVRRAVQGAGHDGSIVDQNIQWPVCPTRTQRADRGEAGQVQHLEPRPGALGGPVDIRCGGRREVRLARRDDDLRPGLCQGAGSLNANPGGRPRYDGRPAGEVPSSHDVSGGAEGTKGRGDQFGHGWISWRGYDTWRLRLAGLQPDMPGSLTSILTPRTALPRGGHRQDPLEKAARTLVGRPGSTDLRLRASRSRTRG